jgi:hypothetical protein
MGKNNRYPLVERESIHCQDKKGEHNQCPETVPPQWLCAVKEKTEVHGYFLSCTLHSVQGGKKILLPGCRYPVYRR